MNNWNAHDGINDGGDVDDGVTGVVKMMKMVACDININTACTLKTAGGRQLQFKKDSKCAYLHTDINSDGARIIPRRRKNVVAKDLCAPTVG